MANIRGLIPGTRRDKVQFISALANETAADIIILTETHLDKRISDSEISFNGWFPLRADREDRQKGGAAIYFSDSVVVNNELSFSNSVTEAAMGYIAATNTAVIALYRPPRCPEDKFREALAVIESWITKVESISEKSPTVVIGGDFNFPSMRAWRQSDMEKISSNPAARLASDSSISEDRDKLYG